MKTVVVIATGGTIAMKYDEATGGLVPAVMTSYLPYRL